MFYFIWLLFIISCVSATDIIIHGNIFEELRNRLTSWTDSASQSAQFHVWFQRKVKKLVTCSMCAGFHVGWLMYLLFSLAGISLFPSFLLGLLVSALVSSRISYFCIQSFNDDGFHFSCK